jgi:UDP-hydrolysing UDP-N-acetyl-D-glucosamine 2-epimerase
MYPDKILDIKKQRRVCVVLVDRANYGRMHPVMRAIKNDDDLELVTVCAGTMLLERFGQAENTVVADGFSVEGRVYMEVEGSMPSTMAKSIGLGVIEFSSEFQRLKPDIVLLIGDRYEAFSASIAAAYMNIPIAHIQGGEVSGSIDESARHAITKLAHIHFPSTERAAENVLKMGEHRDYIFNVGCPSGDYIIDLDTHLPKDLLNKEGVGGGLDLDLPFILVIYHPVTSQFENERNQAEQLLRALDELAFPTLWIWPNIDAGGDHISKAIRVYREHNDAKWLHLVKNLDPVTYQKCLKKTVCAVGNSSSFIRDSTFSGTPVVLVGERQVGREHGENLKATPIEKNSILATIKEQLSHGPYDLCDIYGDGFASEKIIKHLKNVELYTQKKLHY